MILLNKLFHSIVFVLRTIAMQNNHSGLILKKKSSPETFLI